MAIAPTFQKYLATQNVQYDIVAHEPTKSSMRTAEACRISGDRIAKAVVLRDEYGYVLAILPASRHIRLDDLRTQLGLDVELAAEYEIEELFDDCLPGAIPPAGECYGLDTMVDDSIEDQPEVYMEGGDHETLVHMSHSLLSWRRHGMAVSASTTENSRWPNL
jgi:Ala-tRNA(Pro) deacylase